MSKVFLIPFIVLSLHFDENNDNVTMIMTINIVVKVSDIGNTNNKYSTFIIFLSLVNPKSQYVIPVFLIILFCSFSMNFFL